MGIVVTVFMLLGLLLLSPVPIINMKRYSHIKGFVSFIGVGLLLTGLWNLGWFGLRHPAIFWGQAAIVSGVFMIVIAVFIIDKHDLIERAAPATFFKRMSLMLKPLYVLFFLGLLLSFILYLVALVQLNLGYSIIQ